MPSPEGSSKIGDRLGEWRIQRPLGTGGMGNVYLAERGEERAALKVVHPHLLETPGFFKRFLREAELGRAVSHPNVVRTLDCDAVGGHHFLVMEYVEGQTLRALLGEFERVPEELCRHIGREVAKGLAAIHRAGAVHRDLKPENVLITSDHDVKVMDLGVAHLMDEAVRLSQTGMFVGSIHYAAPEQFAGGDRRIDARSDLHAVGTILYELATGVHPFYDEDVRRAMRRVIDETPRRISEENPQLSAFYEEVVHKLLQKDPAGRFADAAELLAALEGGEESPWWRERARALRVETKRPLRRIRIPRETAVYGRESELERLVGLYRRAAEGDGQAILVEGEAGIGKSRLIDELVARLEAEGEELNFLFGSYPPGGAATAAGAWCTAYLEHFGEQGAAEYLTATPALAPAFDALLRGEPTPAGEARLTKDSLQTCFVHATRALAAERPTIVLIDDLHFSPEEGRALFAALALAVPGHRILLVGTSRRGLESDWRANLDRFEQFQRMELSRLGPKDLVRLLTDTLGSVRLAEELGVKIAYKSDGNPFFVFEILRELREGRFLTRLEDGSWGTTRRIREIEIPSSVLDLVGARVADLTEEERDLLDVSACVGFTFDPSLVSEVVGLARVPTLKRLAQIERRHRIVRSSGRDFIFDHHQIQEALYGSLPEMLREEYHAAIAKALERRWRATGVSPDELEGGLALAFTEHSLKGRREKEALATLGPALAHLAASWRSEAWLALADRVLAVPGLIEGEDRADLLLTKASWLDHRGSREEQRTALGEALELAQHMGSAGLEGRVLEALGSLEVILSRHEEAREYLERAVRKAGEIGDRRIESRARDRLGLVDRSEGRVEEAKEQFQRALDLAREVGDRKGEAIASGNLGTLFELMGLLPEAKEHHERHLELVRKFGDRRGEANARGNLGNVHSAEGRQDEARESLDICLSIFREIGYRRGEATAVGNLGVISLDERRFDEAEALIRHQLELSREIGDPRGEAMATLNLGLLARGQDRLQKARERGEEALTLFRDVGYRWGEAETLAFLGEILEAGGRHDEAAVRRDEARRVSGELGG